MACRQPAAGLLHCRSDLGAGYSDCRQKNAAIALHRADLDWSEIEQREGFRVTTPLREITETAEAGADHDVLDSTVADLLNCGTATRRQLLHAAQRLGARAELGVERALHVALP